MVPAYVADLSPPARRIRALRPVGASIGTGGCHGDEELRESVRQRVPVEYDVADPADLGESGPIG